MIHIFSEKFNSGELLNFNEACSLFFTGGREYSLFQNVPTPALFTIIHGTAAVFIFFTTVIINVL